MADPKVVQALGEIEGLSLNHLYDPKTKHYFAPYNPYFEETQALNRTGITGVGITAAIIDTGVLSHHPRLKGQIVDSVDFTGEGPEDLNGHGTIVTLIFLAGAPEANVLNVKVLDRYKQGTEDDLISGLRWAENHGALLINVSLGIPRQCDGTCQICNEVRRIVLDSGLMVVAAAGNEPGVEYCPAQCEEAISIGATDYSGVSLADYTSAGEFYAPGSFDMVPVDYEGHQLDASQPPHPWWRRLFKFG